MSLSMRRLSDGSVGSTIDRVPERRRDPARSMPTSRFDLQRFAPFRLGRLAARAATAFAAQGVGEAEWFVLIALSRDGPGTAQAIVRATGAHKTRISRAVADLVERGLVSREDGAADRREYLLRLTPAGRALVDELVLAALEIEQRLMAPLTPEERRLLDRLLNKLEAAVDDATAPDRRP
ncbi:MarR family winged helix-turn-helix transcriptional regulator [Methyloraptor flagellatus]|uniref:MarR family transcriptional regulator n=1 Tax=Methyloraptor flagellatus TaxID=3162530 RepID=A0AAU7XAP7_9HYPH